MKKRILRIAAAIFIIAAFLPGCDLLEDCGTCEYVVYIDGVETTRGPATPFCGDSYQDKLNDPGVQVGDNLSIWECY